MPFVNIIASIRLPEPSGWSATIRKTIIFIILIFTLAGLIATMVWAIISLHNNTIQIVLLAGIICLSMLEGALVITTINLNFSLQSQQNFGYKRQHSPDLALIHPAYRNDYSKVKVTGGLGRNFSIPRERCIDPSTQAHPLPPLPASKAFIATGPKPNESTVIFRPLPATPIKNKAIEPAERPQTPSRPLPPVPTSSNPSTVDVNGTIFELQTPEKDVNMLTPIVELQEPTPTPEATRRAMLLDMPINKLSWDKQSTAGQDDDKLGVPTINKHSLPSKH